MSSDVASAPASARRMPHLLAATIARVGVGGVVAASVFLLIALACALAPVIAPHPPDAQDLLQVSTGPTGDHLLGTDDLGRDLLSRLLWGGRTTLIGPLIVIFAATIVAVPLAAMVAWYGGKVDLAISRVFDLLFAFPSILLAMLVVAMTDPGLVPCSVALALAYMPWIARVARAALLKERAKPYIAAAEVQGLSGFAICRRHLIPNISPIICAQVTIAFGYALVDLASLSFLGLNIQAPTADWGVMVNNQKALLSGAYAEIVYPGLLIVICVASVTYLGHRLSSETGDPR